MLPLSQKQALIRPHSPYMSLNCQYTPHPLQNGPVPSRGARVKLLKPSKTLYRPLFDAQEKL